MSDPDQQQIPTADGVPVHCAHTAIVPLDNLRPYPRNAKQHPADQIAALAKLIRHHGWRYPITVSNQSGYIVRGHARREAAAQLGLQQVPVDHQNYSSEEDERADRLADNRIAELGEVDRGLLREELLELDTGLMEMDLTGYSDSDRKAILRTAQPGQDTAPGAPPATPITKPGDLWTLGDHWLLCGDCADAQSLTALFQQERYELLVTDPPYGVSYADKNRYLNVVAPANRIQVPIASDHQSPDEMESFWRKAFGAVRQFAKPGAGYYVTGPQGGELLLLLLQTLIQVGFPLRHMLIWAKNNHVLGRADYNYKHEPIIYGWVEGAGHRFYGGTGETSLWAIDRPHQSKLHPTMKPVGLYERAMGNSSREGEIICDPFAGSGTALIAAENLGRRCYAMEIDPAYCDVCVARWAEHTGQDPVRERGEERATWSELQAAIPPDPDVAV